MKTQTAPSKLDELLQRFGWPTTLKNHLEKTKGPFRVEMTPLHSELWGAGPTLVYTDEPSDNARKRLGAIAEAANREAEERLVASLPAHQKEQ